MRHKKENSGSRFTAAKIALLIGCGLPMAYATLAQGLAEFWTLAAKPDKALQAWPTYAAALWNTSNDALAQSDFVTAHRAAKAALNQDPLDLRPFVTLALVAQKKGQLEDATALMGFAGRLSWRNSTAQSWLLTQALFVGDGDQLLMRSDALLRTQEAQPFVIGVLQSLTLTPAMRTAIAERLADGAPWRGQFLAAMEPSGPQLAAAEVAMVEDVHHMGSKVGEREISPFLMRLIAEGYGAAAARLWSEIASTARGTEIIDDPDGQSLSTAVDDTGSPFRWQTGNRADANITTTTENGSPAIAVDAGSNPTFGLAFRFVALPPAEYTLHYETSGDNDGRIGADILCVGPGKIKISLPEREQIQSGRVRNLVRFQVPARQCTSQKLRFNIAAGRSMTPSEMTISGIAIDASARSG